MWAASIREAIIIIIGALQVELQRATSTASLRCSNDENCFHPGSHIKNRSVQNPICAADTCSGDVWMQLTPISSAEASSLAQCDPNLRIARQLQH